MPPDTNPYAAPQTDVGITPSRANFYDIDTKSLKKLRNNSHTLRTLGLLNALAVFVILFLLIITEFFAGNMKTSVIMSGSALFGIASAYSFWSRPHWGRVMGYICCAVMLIGIPIGTLVGILGIIALAQGGVLFGANRYPHGKLEKEWKYRKKHNIA